MGSHLQVNTFFSVCYKLYKSFIIHRTEKQKKRNELGSKHAKFYQVSILVVINGLEQSR
jgi:hypothetical protein